MPVPVLLSCDGCGQLSDTSHISRRLQRLAWTSRYRPVHIQSLLLGGVAPKSDSEFLYAAPTAFEGEARTILTAVQLSTDGKSAEVVLAEFQKLGLLLTHVLECPVEESLSAQQLHDLLAKQLPATLARIRRSLKPKRILLISSDVRPLADKLRQGGLDCPILPTSTGAFLPTAFPAENDLQAFRTALSGTNAHAV